MNIKNLFEKIWIKLKNIFYHFFYKFAFNFFVSKKIIKIKVNNKKNLLILNTQESLGDQIIFLDLLSRINNLNLKNSKWSIIYPDSFKELLKVSSFENIDFIFLKKSIGPHFFYPKFSFIKIFFRIISLKKSIKKLNLEFDNVFFPSRYIDIDNLTIATNIKCNKIYKWLDWQGANEKSIQQIGNLFTPLNSLNNLYYKYLKNKTKIYTDVSNEIHYSKNLWNFFCFFEKDINKNVKFTNCYELIWNKNNIKKITSNKKTLKITICVNREIPKVFILELYIFILNELSKKNDILVTFVGIFSNKKIVNQKIRIIENMCKFPYENKIQKSNLRDLISTVKDSDLLLTEDTWLCHMGNLFMKDTIVFFNKDYWRIKSINYWNGYNTNNKKYLYKIFYLNENFFYSKNEDYKKNYTYIKNNIIPYIEKNVLKKYYI